MSKFILTFKLECTTQKGSDTYSERYQKLLEYLEKECTEVIHDETTSTIICEANMPIYNSANKDGLAYNLLEEGFLLYQDKVLFFRFKDGKFGSAGRIINKGFKFDNDIENMLKN